ncbi:hypothetical protein HYX07_03315, partial [Candidatus Woesearchaeota archaeon]|nr:hypothetical protein [Candidatus Woesearchaeota archaeon]
MNKKAFEVQFNWIFVLIAGAAILLFFTAIVIKQKSVAETSTKATVLKSIEAIVIGAGVSTDTTNIISIPSSDIEIGCNRVSLGIVSKQHENLILFAPSLIKGDKLITQTMPFNVPYRATNFLFITSPQFRYIIIGNNQLARDINKTLPSELKKEFYTSIPEIKNSNNYRIRFIILSDMVEFPKSLAKMPDFDVTAIKINGDLEKGTLEFWQKDGISWQAKGSAPYIGKASLMGAVYADSLDIYNCNMQNAFSRLSLVTRIYIDKTKKLVQKESISSRQIQCNQLYNNGLAQLSSIFSASSAFNHQNVNAISDSAKSLAG